MTHRVMEVYADEGRTKLCVNIASGTGIFDTMTNGSDHFHLSPGDDKADMFRFGDWKAREMPAADMLS